jgi:hypothetical protein
MRDIKALAFVCSLIAAAACATSGGDGGGDDGPPVNNTPVCGDSVCAASEVGNCSSDCGTGMTEVCGNGMCEGNEPTTCASDCTMGGGGVCGNGQCESSESASTCPADCNTGGGGGNIDCQNEDVLAACILCLTGIACINVTETDCTSCATGGIGCTGGLPNGVCDAGETTQNCPFDCM